MEFDDLEFVAPPPRFVGDVRLDEVREGRERCGVARFVDAAERLLDDLNSGREFVLDAHDIVALTTRRDQSWCRYVDPALSTAAPRGAGPHRVVLYECAEHIIELRGRDRRWVFFLGGAEVGVDDIAEIADEPDDLTELEPDELDDEAEAFEAEREHLLRRLAAEEERRIEAEAKAQREIKRLRIDNENARQRLGDEIDKERALRQRAVLERADFAERARQLADSLEASEREVAEMSTKIRELVEAKEAAVGELSSEIDRTKADLAHTASGLTTTRRALVEAEEKYDQLLSKHDELSLAASATSANLAATEERERRLRGLLQVAEERRRLELKRSWELAEAVEAAQRSRDEANSALKQVRAELDELKSRAAEVLPSRHQRRLFGGSK